MSVSVVRFTINGVPRDAEDPLADTSAGASGVGEGRPYTVVYDGHCKVCGRLVAVLRTWDARASMLEIVPSQLPGLDVRFPWIPPAAYIEALQMVGPGGKTWSGSAAVEQLLAVLPRGRWIAWVFAIPFARTLADRFYRWFARNRYRLGCGEHCAMHPA